MSETAISYGETIWDPASYDAARRRLVPSYDLLYGAVAATVAALPVEPVRVLDLGAGTGLLAAEVLARRPDARLTLLDGDPAMLDRARARFAGRDGVATVHGDLTGELPAGPYDAVVSALAVHHLDDTDKRALFGRVRASLTDSGVFVDLDQVLGPTPELEAAYAVMHERHARAHGSDDAEWAAALGRMAHDRSAPLADQLGWLRAAGFATADCLVKDWRFAAFAGWAGTALSPRTGPGPSGRAPSPPAGS